MGVLVAPSVLAADFSRLSEEIKMVNQSEADWIHVDIMDGVFVPNISFGFPVLEAIHREARKPLDVHLMIVQPERYVEAFSKAGAGLISVHFEACPHLHRNIQQIKALGCKAGVALNPHTPVSLLAPILEDLDLVCIMSVNPGFGGQKFIEKTYERVEELKNLILKRNAKVLIEVDGGVNTKNAAKLVGAGVDVLVAGNVVFSDDQPAQVIAQLKAVQVGVSHI